MFFKYNKYAFGIALVIFVLCMLPGSKVPQYDIPHLDKIAHFILFGALCWSLLYGFKNQTSYAGLAKAYSVYALLFGIAYGFFIEVCQHTFITSRSFELADVAADTVGVLIFRMIYLKIHSKITT